MPHAELCEPAGDPVPGVAPSFLPKLLAGGVVATATVIGAETALTRPVDASPLPAAALIELAGTIAFGAVLAAAAAGVAEAAVLRVARLGTRGLVVAVVAATLVLGPALGPIFLGPEARRLPAAPLLPWVVAAAASAIVVPVLAAFGRRRTNSAVARAAAFGLGVVACVAVLVADGRFHRGGYERFHELLAIAAFAAPAWGGLGLLGARRPSVVGGAACGVALATMLAGGVVATRSVAADPGLMAEFARRSSAAWRVAAEWGARVDGAEASPPVVEAGDDPTESAIVEGRREHAAAVAADARARRPSLVLLVVDGLRAECGPGGARGAELMPRTTRWAAEAAVFARAYAPSITSWPSVRSVLTGLYPAAFEEGVEDPPSLFSIAKELGYRTLFASGVPILDREARMWLPSFDGSLDERVDRGSTEDLVGRLRAFAEGRGPFCAWVHPCGTHAPYDVPPDFVRGAGEEPAYEAAVRRTDNVIAPLLEDLARRDVYVALFADHGEEFFREHGFTHHGRSVYEYEVRVPLVIGGPGVRAGRREEVVTLVDLLPTLLGCVGLTEPPAGDGVSLLPALVGAEARALGRRDAVFAEALRGHRGDAFARPRRAMIAGTSKLILTRAPTRLEAFDLGADPEERRNLFVSDPPAAGALHARFQRRDATRKALAAADGRVTAAAYRPR